MKTLQEIEARLAEIASEIETRGAQFTADELAAREAEVTELKETRAALIAANEKRAALLSSIAEGREPGAAVVRSFPSPATPGESRAADNDDPYDTMEYRRAFMAHVLRGAPIPAEYRADAVTKTTDVGATIPTTTLNKIIEKIEAVGMILPLVTRTAYKGGVSIPTSTAKPVATWVAEGSGSDKQKKATGSITFNYYKLRCAVAVSLEVDAMALSAFEATLINNVVAAMTKALEQAIVSGDGSGKPKGILTETPAADQAIESAAPSYKDLIDAEAALPVEYENGAVWCMSKKTFMQYYGLQDETGQPIGRVNYGLAGKPERSLLGRPVVVCDYVTSYADSMAANTVFAFLFNFKDYVLNTNYAMGLKKYEDNDTDDQVTKAVMLADGKVVDKNSLVTISKSA
jgi:HK97 family phage major capsid protein